jgi:hypothetical protein
MKKEIGARSFTRSTLGVGGVLELQGVTKMNSQTRIQNEINLHNQGKKAVNVS